MARNSNNTRTNAPKGRIHNLILHALRILQLLSALISLIFFSIRLQKIIRLTKHATQSNGAVEGILAAAVLYTIIVTILQVCIRAARSQAMRILLAVLDVLFVGAFIAVAILTSPKRHGSSGPCRSRSSQLIKMYGSDSMNCNLPWGTFILAIFSTILHAITSAYHAARQDRHNRRYERNDQEVHQSGVNNGGFYNGDKNGGGL